MSGSTFSIASVAVAAVCAIFFYPEAPVRAPVAAAVAVPPPAPAPAPAPALPKQPPVSSQARSL